MKSQHIRDVIFFTTLWKNSSQGAYTYEKEPNKCYVSSDHVTLQIYTHFLPYFTFFGFFPFPFKDGLGEVKYLGTNETNINTHTIMKTLLVLRKLEICTTVIAAEHLTPTPLDYYAGHRVLVVYND